MNTQDDQTAVVDNSHRVIAPEHGRPATDHRANDHLDNGPPNTGLPENGHSENGQPENKPGPSGPNWNSWIHGDDPTDDPAHEYHLMDVSLDLDTPAVEVRPTELSDRDGDDAGRARARTRATLPENRLNTPVTPVEVDPIDPVFRSRSNGHRAAPVPVVSVPLTPGSVATPWTVDDRELNRAPSSFVVGDSFVPNHREPDPPISVDPASPIVSALAEPEPKPQPPQPQADPPAAVPITPIGSGDVPIGSADRREPLIGPRATINVREVLGYLVVACIITAASTAGAFFISGQRTPLYGARAEIRYPLDADQSTGFLREDRQLSTQILLLTSRSMLAPIARDEKIPFETLEKKISASVVSQSEIIHLEAKDEDADVALALVMKISENYLNQVTGDVSAERREYLETEIGLIGSRLDEIVVDKRTIVRGLDPTETASDALLSALTAEELQLLQRRNALESEIDSLVLDNLRVGRPALMSSPFILEDPVSPNTMQDTAIGLAVGVLLATGAVFALRVWNLNRRARRSHG